MSSVATAESGSMPTLLGVAFIVLKLTHVIAWSWVWVLAPYWLPFALVLFVFGIYLILAVLSAVVDGGRR